MKGVPLKLYLPGGLEAALIPGSDPAQYEGWNGSVEIPSDLVDKWFWFGSFLSDGEVAVFTGTFGVEGAFDQARIHERLRADYAPQPTQLELFEAAA